MKLSASAWSIEEKLFNKDMSIFDFIKLCNKNGLKYVELLDCFWNDAGDIDQVLSLLKQLNMEVAAYSIGNDFVQESLVGRQDQIVEIKKGIDTACKLKTGLLRVFSGEPKDGISFDTAKVWIIDGLRQAAAYAEEMGITMVLENHGLFAGKSCQVKDLINQVGSANLRANTDVGNFMLVNENPLEAVKALKDYIGFVHFKDFKEVTQNDKGYTAIDGRKYQGTIFGRGEVPMEEIVNFLYKNGYDGFLSVEYEGIGDQVSGMLESIEFTKSIIK